MTNTLPNPYDDLDLGSAGFKPDDDEVGAFITITCSDETPKRVETKEGKVGVAIYGVESDGTKRDWVAWNMSNKREVAATKPLPGDKIKITYLGRDRGASNPALAAKLFKIEVLSRAGKVELDEHGLPVEY